MSNPYSKCPPCSSKSCNHPTPLTLIKVEFFEKHSKGRCKMLESSILFMLKRKLYLTFDQNNPNWEKGVIIT